MEPFTTCIPTTGATSRTIPTGQTHTIASSARLPYYRLHNVLLTFFAGPYRVRVARLTWTALAYPCFVSGKRRQYGFFLRKPYSERKQILYLRRAFRCTWRGKRTPFPIRGLNTAEVYLRRCLSASLFAMPDTDSRIPYLHWWANGVGCAERIIAFLSRSKRCGQIGLVEWSYIHSVWYSGTSMTIEVTKV